MNESSTPTEISDQIAALRRQVCILLVVLVIVSGTLTVFLYRQVSLTRRDFENIKPQAEQLVEGFKQTHSAITNFVEQLVLYGQAHPDFQQQVLRKYGLTPQSVAAMK
jgi:hypothetical protein